MLKAYKGSSLWKMHSLGVSRPKPHPPYPGQELPEDQEGEG